MKGMGRRGALLLVGVGVLAALGTAGYVFSTSRTPATRFRTAVVDRGTIVATVSATGALAAVTTVQVGSQVSGQIREVLVDFNSQVRKGQLIARIDPDVFQARLNAATADLESAQAQVLNQRANVEKVRADVENTRAAASTAEANVERMRADVENARAVIATAQANVARDTATTTNARVELERRADLIRRELISKSERDQAQTTFDTAQAQLEATRAQERAGQAALRSSQAQLAASESQARAAKSQIASAQATFQVAEAQLKAADATVRQKRAAVEQTRLDVVHTEIRAPVDGVVVSRAIDPGQTVAASLQAPTLFTIAQDLTRMQVEAAVDEADVGRLREGMSAVFTVDAFPGRSFRGEISQIRKAAQVVQNVVSYTTVITVPNPDRSLLPGMTANVRVQVDRREDALRVSNAALRFRPPTEGGAEPAPAGRAGARAAGDDPGGRGQAAKAGGSGRRRVRWRNGWRASRDAGHARAGSRPDPGAADEARRDPGGGPAGVRAPREPRRGDDKAGGPQRRRGRAEVREKIRAILTPEQQKRFDASLPAAEGGPAARPPSRPRGSSSRARTGSLRRSPIMVGLSDGTYSEVVSGRDQGGPGRLRGHGVRRRGTLGGPVGRPAPAPLTR